MRSPGKEVPLFLYMSGARSAEQQVRVVVMDVGIGVSERIIKSKTQEDVIACSVIRLQIS